MADTVDAGTGRWAGFGGWAGHALESQFASVGPQVFWMATSEWRNRQTR